MIADSRLHDQDASMVAGHDSTTLDKGPGGDIGGHVTSMPLFSLSLTHYYFLDLGNEGRPCGRRSPTRDHFGVIDYLGLLAV